MAVSRKVAVAGHTLHYLEAGRPRRPSLVLLHGWGASAKFWRQSLRVLSRHYRVIALDLLGFGQSEKPVNGYSIEHHAELVTGFIKQVGLAGSAVIGHSMGGMVAIKVVAESPRIASRLVLVATPARGERGLSLMASTAAALPFQQFTLLAKKAGFLVEFMLQNFVSIPVYDREVLEEARSLPVHVLHGATQALRTADLSHDLPRVRIPTLIIHASGDRLVRAEEALFIERTIQGSQVVEVADTGHCLTWEKPRVFHAAVRQFLAATTPADPIRPSRATA